MTRAGDDGDVRSSTEPASGPDGGRLSIVPMRRSHLRAVQRIDAVAYPEPWSRGLWLAELDRDNRVYRVAEWVAAEGARRRRPRVLGYVGAMLAGDDLHIMTIATEPGAKRRGIAATLLTSAVEEGLRLGATALTLEVRVSNTPAQALYRRFGLAPAGVRRGYYQPEGEDALIMWAHDIDGDDYRARLESIRAASFVGVPPA